MRRHHTLAWMACSVFTAGFLTTASAQHQHTTGPMSDEDIIRGAMAAAPPAVAKDATIVDVSADGTTRVVHKGSNGFTCLPDNPNSPGPDPMCGDQNAMEWAQAWIEKKDPPQNKVGFMYMLSDGTDASNTDPFADKPDTSQPYVMWPDTPYEHLMLPVQMPEPATR